MVDLDSAQQVDMSLDVIEKVEEITVSESAARVETESTQVGEVVTTRQMTAIALNGRSYTDLLALQPGITPMSTQQPDSVVMAGSTVAISAFGHLESRQSIDRRTAGRRQWISGERGGRQGAAERRHADYSQHRFARRIPRSDQ